MLIVVLLGGFTTNFLWCLGLSIRNKTGGEYSGRTSAPHMQSKTGDIAEISATEAVEPWDTQAVTRGGAATLSTRTQKVAPTPLLHN